MIPSPYPPPFNLCPATTTFQFLKTFLSSIGQQTTTVITAGYPMVAQVFRESSVPMQCPYCHANITTTTTYETGTLTWLICGILILFGYVSMLSYDPVPPNLLISVYDRKRTYIKSLNPIHFVKILLSKFLGNEFHVKMYKL